MNKFLVGLMAFMVFNVSAEGVSPEDHIADFAREVSAKKDFQRVFVKQVGQDIAKLMYDGSENDVKEYLDRLHAEIMFHNVLFACMGDEDTREKAEKCFCEIRALAREKAEESYEDVQQALDFAQRRVESMLRSLEK